MANKIDSDRRDDQRPIWKHTCTQMSWATGAGHAEATEDVNICGYVTQLVATISTATDDPDVVFSLKVGSTAYYTSAAQNDGQAVVLNPNTYFNDVVTVSADPDKDAGASGLTVDIVLYGT